MCRISMFIKCKRAFNAHGSFFYWVSKRVSCQNGVFVTAVSAFPLEFKIDPEPCEGCLFVCLFVVHARVCVCVVLCVCVSLCVCVYVLARHTSL